MCITDAGNAIFTPSVGSESCVFVREVWRRRKHILVLLCNVNSTHDPGTPDFEVAEVDLRKRMGRNEPVG